MTIRSRSFSCALIAFLFACLFLLGVYSSALAREKQKAALAPIGTLGDISEMEQQIIFNTLQESLSTHYLLASQKAFEVAQEEAFQELDYEECTEDQCFALIQQILQVDNLFLFNMTREASFTQLSLTRVDLDSQRLVRTAFCDGCGIGQLNSKVEGLVRKIVDASGIPVAGVETPAAGTRIQAEPKPEPPPQPEPQPEQEPEPEPLVEGPGEPSPNQVWHITATALTVVSALVSYNAAKSYNELSDKNQELANSYASSGSASTKSEYENNQATMKTLKSRVQLYDSITLLGLGWEAYLLFSDSKPRTAAVRHPPVSLLAGANSIEIRWQWRF